MFYVWKSVYVPEIAIIPGIVAANQMAKSRFAMTPFLTHANSLGPIDLGDFSAQGVVRGGNGQLLDLLVSLWLVHGHVKDTKMKLAQIEQSVVDMLRADQILDNVVGNPLGGLRLALGLLLPGSQVFGGQGGIVSTKRFELRRGPAPILQHLAGRLDEVAHSVGPVETRVDCPRDKIMNAVSKLVEQCHNFVVLEKAGFFGRRFGEVANERRRGIVAVARCIDKTLDQKSQLASYY